MIGADRVYTAHLLATMFLPIAHFNIPLIRPVADFLAQTPRKSTPVVAAGILRQVSIETESGNKSTAISAADINAIFGSQYGKPIEIATLQLSIDKLKALYEDRGFNLSYNEPWIAGDPHRTSYEFNLFGRQSRSLIFSGGKTPTFVPNSTEDPRISFQPNTPQSDLFPSSAPSASLS
jgi:outer membrane protein assembly factor BamA